ncbi:ankyrin repeat domain protein [Aspergillus bombycis]|uniref:Ankyrin repeat domain protein n=1 Tax=Aspergillus bombycis TaxID=109264 RepID=A0A1F7ZQE0_9EURO|nr:ankyrin repeat domain protein [Aspergillus bombycis]OGM41663.1 ankyrin repeat domain protein [Aspergillus bombycis]
MSSRRRHQDYAIGWICPLAVEQTAALLMLDETHDRLSQQPADQNVYTLGSIGGHNIVVAGLHQAGNSPAATVVTQMRNTFPNIHYVLLVGIGGGVPVKTESGWVRLGDVVVSKPVGEYPGVVQYDTGKAEVGQFKRIGALPPPPVVLLQAAQDMEVKRVLLRAQDDPIAKALERIPNDIPALGKYLYPGPAQDRLYYNDYTHKEPGIPCDECKCDPARLRLRDDPSNTNHNYVRVHRGVIASGGMVIKDANKRDELAVKYSVLCFETEAAGILADLPALVIRGVADYCDSHKNDQWHGYAATTAAAYARQLILHMPTYNTRRSYSDEVPSNNSVVNTASPSQIIPLAHLYQQMQTLRLTAARLQPSVSDQRKELAAWIGGTMTDDEYHAALSVQMAGTCRWILERTQFKVWAASASEVSKVLWIRGGPGCGKTVLTASIIRHATSLPTGYPRPAAYFFCTHEDERKQDLNEIARSWVRQIVDKVDDAVTIAHPLCEENKSRGATMMEVWEILYRICHGVDNCMLFLDGLDECVMSGGPWHQDKESFLARLWSTIGGTTARVLISSRGDADIHSQFLSARQDTITFLEYSIALEDTTQDIIDYSTRVVSERLGVNKDQAFIHEISKDVARKCDGMFLWVRLMGRQLSPGKNKHQIRRTLGSMPQGLEKTYQREIQSILNLSVSEKVRATRILRWTYFAARPLTVRELTEALLTEANSLNTYPFDEMPDAWDEYYVNDQIRKYCQSLIDIRGSATSSIEMHTVHFIHTSVKEYLSQTGICAMDQDFPFSEAAKQHELLGRTCLTYLCFDELTTSDPYDVDILHDKKETFRFLDYASLFWYGHVVRHGNCLQRLERSIRLLFDPSSTRWIMWSELVSQKIWPASTLHEIKEGNRPTALHIASCLGLLDTVEWLLSLGSDLDATAWRFGSALHSAAGQGHRDTVQLLLTKGAHPNKHGGLFGYPIVAAAAAAKHDSRKSADIVHMLLQAGAEISCRDRTGRSALHYSAAVGSAESVTILLQHGATIDDRDDHQRTPLFLAAAHGHRLVTELLIKRGAEVSIRDVDSRTPLFAAIQNGHLPIVEILAQYDINVKTQDNAGLTPLHIAVKLGHQQMVALLLRCGADANAVDQDGMTPMFFAALGGDKTIVHDLIQHRAQINGKTSLEAWTPLHAACAMGNEATTVLLLENGVEVDAADSNGHTALFYAAGKGLPATIEILIQYNAQVNATQKHGLTPIYVAIAGVQPLAIEALIKYGGSNLISDQCASLRGYTPLMVAMLIDEFRPVVPPLVRAGLWVNSHADSGLTPLHLATQIGDLGMLELLLQHDAAVNAMTNGGWTPLHLAVSEGRTDIVQLLLDHNADVNAERNEVTPIYLAIENKDVLTTEALVRSGAEADVPLAAAIKQSDEDKVRFILQHGPDIGREFLIYANRYGHDQIVQLMVHYFLSKDTVD